MASQCLIARPQVQPIQAILSPRPGVAAPWAAWAMLAGILAGGLVLRCYQISTRSFWLDEAFSFRLSQFPVAEVFVRAAQDNSPPLYFLLLKVWAGLFGSSLLALRSLSVIMGELTILGMYLFTVAALRDPATDAEAAAQSLPRRRGVGLWVAALVALSVFQVRWSWDVRMYSLGTALAAFSSWALFRALHADSRRFGPWLGYALLAVLFAYTHYFALFTITAQGLFVLGWLLVRVRGRIASLLWEQRFWRALLAWAVIIAGWLPWVPAVLHQRGQVQADFWAPSVTPRSIRDNGYRMMVEPEDPIGVSVDWATGSVGLLCAGLCMGAPLVLLRKGRAGDWFVAGAVLVPLGLSGLATLTLATRVFYSRYFLFAHLFILASIALLLCRIEPPWKRRTLGGLLLLLCLAIHLRFVERLDLPHRPGASAVTDYLAEKRRPGEPVVVSSPMFYLPLRYHAAEGAGAFHCLERSRRIHWQGWNAITAEDVLAPEELGKIRSERIWVIDLARWSQGGEAVPAPRHWVARSRKRFPEAYGLKMDMIVVEYENLAGG